MYRLTGFKEQMVTVNFYNNEQTEKHMTRPVSFVMVTEEMD